MSSQNGRQTSDKTTGWQMSDERRSGGRLRQREGRGPEQGRWMVDLGARPSPHPGWGSGSITSGDGSSSGFWESSSCVTSMSPRMVWR